MKSNDKVAIGKNSLKYTDNIYKAKVKKSDNQTKIYKSRVATNIKNINIKLAKNHHSISFM